MRTRLILAALVVTVPLCLTLIGRAGPPPDTPPDHAKGKPDQEQAKAVQEAVAKLASYDYVVVRRAISDLEKLINARNINSAVDPLIAILERENGTRSPYTRAKAARLLVNIGREKGRPQGEKPVLSVIDQLLDAKVDIVRASCAKTLGTLDWDLVGPPLIQANEQDPSPLVRDSACEALLSHSNGMYSSPTCGYDPGASASSEVLMFSSPRISTMETESRQDMLDWARNHILLPLDNYMTVSDREE